MSVAPKTPRDNRQNPQTKPPEQTDGWSISLGRVLGIPVRLHATFLVLLAFFLFPALTGVAGALNSLLLIVGLFACVALHELGHSVVAIRYGIPVSSITLYPIGGIARITKRPTPAQELWVAVAGPAVNVVIAAVLAVVISASHGTLSFRLFDRSGMSLLENLFQANVALVLFNLIPAFPMDGGRVLRAVLAPSGMTLTAATNVAARLGQAAAILGGIWALFIGHQFLSAIVALFVYFAAGQEAQVVQQESAFQGVTVSNVMMREVHTLAPGATLKDAADQLLSGAQQDFPVVHGEEVVGLMTRNDLLRGLASEGQDGYVAGIMQREFAHAVPGEEMSRLFTHAAEGNDSFDPRLPLIVLENGHLVGMVTNENLMEYFAIKQILAAAPGGRRGRMNGSN